METTVNVTFFITTHFGAVSLKGLTCILHGQGEKVLWPEGALSIKRASALCLVAWSSSRVKEKKTMSGSGEEVTDGEGKWFIQGKESKTTSGLMLC